MDNKVGIYFAYWEKDWDADFAYYIKKAADLGFDIMELPAVALENMAADKVKELKQLSREYNVDLTFSLGLPRQYDISSRDESTRRRGIEYLKKLLEGVHNAGASLLGGVTYGGWSVIPEDAAENKKEYTELSAASMREVIKVAEDFGITYCLECLNRFEQFIINTCDEALAYIEMVGSPNLKVQLDTFHMNIEEDSMPAAIRKAGEALGHFHIGENNRRPPGMGFLPWRDIFGALKEINYKGPIVMEPFVMSGGQVGKDIRVWREITPGADLDREAVNALQFVRSFF
ncbi:MAG: sugar phosphate isomerase/epimerase family protein [Dethiobacteria bacterium]|jgi:D-psicose/D-tagatose/L-ribulose 3-epimerase|nr:sugar phosphate isomerase/epimerase [Bacillota bacterium]